MANIEGFDAPKKYTPPPVKKSAPQPKPGRTAAGGSHGTSSQIRAETPRRYDSSGNLIGGTKTSAEMSDIFTHDRLASNQRLIEAGGINYGAMAWSNVVGVFPDGSVLTWGEMATGMGGGRIIGYKTLGDKQVPIYSPMSYVSGDGSRINLDSTITEAEWVRGLGDRFAEAYTNDGMPAIFDPTTGRILFGGAENIVDITTGTGSSGTGGGGGSGGGSRGGGGSGGGGASGSAGQYLAPPKNTVAENIRNYVIAVTGFANKAVIDSALNTYMSKDREAFDKRETEQVDPWQAVKETVRNTAAYKALHDMRPDSVDEMDWVTSRQGKLRSIGVQDTRAEKLGISASFSGATDAALVTQGSVATLQDTGRMLQIQRQALQQSAASAASLI